MSLSPDVEDRLCQALVGRGLITRDEFQLVRCADSGDNAETLVGQLVASGYLTASQGVRVLGDLSALLEEQIPGYRLHEQLGKGAMGAVYRGIQLSMDREVAVKILHPRFSEDESYLLRFHREAQTAARFSSPNIVQAIDVGSAGNVHYFVMEYVEGLSIKDALDRKAKFTPQESLAIILQIARALELAHRQNLIHRDVKPANIILALDGSPKLADLGLAREQTDLDQIQAEAGKTIGTPNYISPEQVRGRGDVDIRSDIYSLGATWHHMLTGRPPFTYPKVERVLRAHLDEMPAPPHEMNPEVPEDFSDVLEVMMAKRPADRYVTPTELIVDLESLERGEQPRLATVGGSPTTKSTPFFTRKVGVLWLFAVGWLLVLSLFVNLFLLASRTP
jgi:eukaryotic-like serine/threonine-protein kinase